MLCEYFIYIDKRLRHIGQGKTFRGKYRSSFFLILLKYVINTWCSLKSYIGDIASIVLSLFDNKLTTKMC